MLTYLPFVYLNFVVMQSYLHIKKIKLFSELQISCLKHQIGNFIEISKIQISHD